MTLKTLVENCKKELIELVKISNEKVFNHMNCDNKEDFNKTYREKSIARDDLRCSIYTISKQLVSEYNKIYSGTHRPFHSADFIYCDLVKMLDSDHIINLGSFVLKYECTAYQLI